MEYQHKECDRQIKEMAQRIAELEAQVERLNHKRHIEIEEAGGYIKRIADLEGVLRDLLASGDRACELVHHAKKDRHLLSEPCPVIARYRVKLGTGGGE